jgi:hypothetical protein
MNVVFFPLNVFKICNNIIKIWEIWEIFQSTNKVSQIFIWKNYRLFSQTFPNFFVEKNHWYEYVEINKAWKELELLLPPFLTFNACTIIQVFLPKCGSCD